MLTLNPSVVLTLILTLTLTLTTKLLIRWYSELQF